MVKSLTFRLTGMVAAILLTATSFVPAFASPEEPMPIEIFDRVGAIEAWGMTRGEGITVAIVDSGVAIQHPDLQDTIALNQSETGGIPGVDDDENGYVDDIIGWDFIEDTPVPAVAPGRAAIGNGIDDDGDGHVDSGVSHGTYVAGLIAGKTTGIAPGARIIPIRVLDDEGNGELAHVAAGIDYAWQRGASIIYVGVGFPSDDSAVHSAIIRATAAGSLVVAPSGNSDAVLYPAAYSFVLSVGAETGGSPASFSASGRGVDIAAPGSRLYTTRVAPMSGELGYARVTGTSYSAALVAGAAALVRAALPGLDARGTGDLLTATARHMADDGGAGIVDAGRAIRVVRR